LKEQAHAPRTPVIILSDVDDPDLAISMIRAGAQEFLVKQELDSIPLARALRLAIERARLMNDLRALSWRDSLTGLFNANGLETLGARQLATAQRMGHLLAVIVVDIAGLDELMREYGREERDLALMEVAEILRAEGQAPAAAGCVRPNRFAVAMPVSGAAAGYRKAAQLRRRFHQLRSRSATFDRLRFHYGVHLQEPALEAVWCDLLAEAAAKLCENVGGAPPHGQALDGWQERWARLALTYDPENQDHPTVADAYRS
jgi:diguanylate cyclase (GGDEF)-like protein